MSNDIQAAQDASTKEVLEELAGEGYEIPGQEKAEPKPEAKAEPVEPVKTEETKPEDKPADAPDNKPDAADKPERTPKYVPVNKHNEERHKRQEAERLAAEKDAKLKELEAEIATLKNKPSTDTLDDVRDMASKLAEKHGLDKEFMNEFAESIVSIASKRNVLPDEIKQKLEKFEQLNASAEEKAREQAQEMGFNREFEQVVKEFPQLADRKEDLKQLAFSDGNINTSLRRLALEYVHDNPNVPGKKTAESPTHGRTQTEAIDFENMTEEQFANMSDEQLDLYEQWRTKDKK